MKVEKYLTGLEKVLLPTHRPSRRVDLPLSSQGSKVSVSYDQIYAEFP